MTIPLALIALALVVATVSPRALTCRKWSRQSPRMGIIAWQASGLSVLTAVVMLATVAILPVERVWFDLGHFLHACPDALRRGITGLSGAWSHLASLVVAAVTVAFLLRAVILRGLSVHRGRDAHRSLLDVLSQRSGPLHGAHVIEHDVPLAYCVPGDGGRIVVTTAAIDALDGRQLAAVLAHERAHLAGRHDLVLFGAAVASSAFPWSRFFRAARREVDVLVEMLADDNALRRSDRASLASALVDLGQRRAPDGTLGAAGDTLQRVQRLLENVGKPSRAVRTAVLATSLTLVVAPWFIAVAPAWAAWSGLCEPPGSTSTVA